MTILNKSFLISLASIHSIFAASWTPRAFFPGPNREVTSLIVAAGTLYAGGAFGTFGPFSHPGLMRWDGQTWSPVGSGLEGAIQGLAIDGRGIIYASGNFTRQDGAYGLAVWDGTDWTFPAGAKGLSGWGPIAAVGNAAFMVFESQPSEIYRYDGSALVQLGVKADGFILALEGMEDKLIAGGDFSTIGGVAANHVASFGTGWENMAEGVQMDLLCLAVVDGVLIAGGGTGIGTASTAPRLSRWDGRQWSDFGSLPSSWGYIVNVAGGKGRFYAGGDLLPNQGDFQNGRQVLSEWDGSKWTRIDDYVLNYDLQALAVLNGSVWAAGRFNHSSAPYLGQWDGKTWSPPYASRTQAPSGTISVLNSGAGRMLAAGTFKGPSNDSLTLLAEWTGNGWVERGSAISVKAPPIWFGALEPHGGDVYLCASFASSDLPGLWRLSGGAWKPIGADQGIEVLRSAPDGLYAGGHFTRMGNVDAKHIARWDGAAWHAVGGGLDYPVTALEWDGSSLYAAQANTLSGSGIPSQVSRYSGGQWTVMGTTASAPLFNGFIRTLAMNGNALWAAGEFSGLGLFNAKGVAVWNGSVWKGAGDGLTGVQALTVSPKGEVYATGKFSDPSGSVARWNGIDWVALGEGLAVSDTFNPPMGKAVACLGEDVFVAGPFDYAGGHPSAGFARWTQIPEYLGITQGDRQARIARPVWRLNPDGRLIFSDPALAGIGFDAMGRRRFDIPGRSIPQR